MIEQIKILSKLELTNLFSLNVLRHTKDKKAKKTGIAMGITVAILVMMAMGYVGALSWGYIKLGAQEIVPAYMVFLSSVFTLVFCAFKAGKIIFKESCYEILASMPIKRSALVISRYIRLYAEGLAVAGIVMLPGCMVYALMVKPGVVAIILSLLSVFVVPVIPIVLSVLLGVIITGISSGMKNKALFESLFAIVVVVGILLSTTMMSTMETQDFDLQAMEDVAKELLNLIHKIYPPTIWFAGALGEGSVVLFAVGVLVSAAFFAIVIVLTSVYFEKISRRLHTSTAKHDYKLGELQQKSVRKAITLREARRYFSSGTYVTNTIIGPVMAVIFAISMLFVDLETVLKDFPIAINGNAVIPVFFVGILVMNSPIATSISMEGKEFWVIRTLPISDKDILKSKLMFSVILLAPFFIVGEVIMMIVLKPSFIELVWMIILPMAIVLCALVVGLAVNLKFPKLKWDSDVEVVKQSASAVIGGFGGFLIAIVSAVPLLIVPMKYYNLTLCGVFLVVVVIAVLVNEKNGKFNLKHLS